jgi:CheY-like chemotaxis protein
MTDDDYATLSQPIALVVDDEPLIRMDTADMVADEGYAVVEAHTAEEAFAFLNRHSSLQLLFTDVQTPPGTMNGFELARAVAEKWPHICVVVASGAAEPADGDLPEKAVFLSKPLSARMVHDVIRDHCDKRHE